jgi:lipoprotein-releasing system ATP-binding protein
MNNFVLTATAVSKSFKDGQRIVNVVNEVSLTVARGEIVAIVGKSGCGKSTLLHMLGGLESPSQGNIYWGDQDIGVLSQAQKSRLRNRYLGFVYQFHHLLPEFVAWENVAMPLLLRNFSPKLAKAKAVELLKKVELHDRLYHKTGELSGGERQRVAVARALIGDPVCVLADEPTGNLDDATTHQVFELMLSLQKSQHVAFVMVTHDKEIAKAADRALLLENGRVVV